jgi:glycosyltransferase family protein
MIFFKYIYFLSLFISYKIYRFYKKLILKLKRPKQEKIIQYLQKCKVSYPKICSIEETIRLIVEEKKSISRFGDGEYNLIFGRSIAFQKSNFSLAYRMFDIIKYNTNKDCLVGIIELELRGINEYSTFFWYENIRFFKHLFSPENQYYNARITREISKENIDQLQKAWYMRNILFVSGKNSRFDINHVIFENALQKETIYTLPMHAWDEYDKTFECVKNKLTHLDNPIVICAIGPTATVLADDLSRKGVQCLDIGHITNCYDRIFNNQLKPEELHIN